MAIKIKAESIAKGEVKGNNRKAPCGSVLGTNISAKKFFLALGQMSDPEQVFPKVELIRLAKCVGLTVVTVKGHACGQGEVKADTIMSWYKWGHRGFRDEKPGRPAALITLPKVILDKIT